MKPRTRRAEKRALALASGGIAGLLYQLGVLEALDDAALGFRSTDFDLYLGVGSGAAAATLLASGVPPREISLAFEGASSVLPAFDMDALLKPNYGEIWRKSYQLPVGFWHAVRDNLEVPSELSFQDLLLSMTGVLPSGLYVTDYIEGWVHRALSRPGMEDRFESLPRELFVVATDVDSGRSTVFSKTHGKDVPVSRAVAATSAVPMLFAPVKIGSRHYVDGTMTKMLHLSLALERGTTFNFCVTPIRPIEGGGVGRSGAYLAESGVVSVAKQSLRTLLYSRLMAGLAQYADRPPGVDIVLVEPGSGDGGALFYNVTKPRTRALLKEMGYLRGREAIAESAALFDRHGIRLKAAVPRTAAPASLAASLDKLEARLARRKKTTPASRAAKRPAARARRPAARVAPRRRG